MPSEGPHGLWLDCGRLFCAADGGALVVARPRQRRRSSRACRCPACPTSSCTTPAGRRLYVAIGEPGVVCSFDSDRLEHVETIETEPGAHTIAWDPDGRRLYVFCPESCGAARLRGTRLSPDARRILAAQAARALAYGLGSVLIGVTLADRGLSGAEVGAVLAALLAGTALVSVLIAPLRRPHRPSPLLPAALRRDGGRRHRRSRSPTGCRR